MVTLRVHRTLVLILAVVPVSSGAPWAAAFDQTPTPTEYRVLATNRTSTMERELNEAADAGYRFRAVMGGETAFGGNEVVVVMAPIGEGKSRYAYKLLATNRTSTMQNELQEAADAGYEYMGQTVFKTTFGGDEVVVILERDKDSTPRGVEYRLVATSKTATLQKELMEVGAAGYEVLAMTVSKTAFGGKELVAITRRTRAK